MTRHRRRFSSAPLGVKVTAFLVALDGLVAVLSGLGIVVGAPPVGLLQIIVGALHLVIGYGLFETEPYAYSWGMGVFALGLALDLLTANVYGAGLSALNMYILYHYRGLFRD